MTARKPAVPNHYGPNVLHAAQYKAIVAYVIKEGPCSFDTLFELFADTSESTYPSKTFRNRLTNLQERGELVVTGTKDQRRWSLGAKHGFEPVQPVVQPVHPTRPAAASAYIGTVAPPGNTT